ncbi:MAG: DUF3631 domain-containing protein [Gammaproteobacteria bacterium]|nr:DUF3631 domain-containing protein [Gammaproteobacteria bacterium]
MLLEAIKRHVHLFTSAAIAIVLWIVFTYLHDYARISPLLGVTSPQKRCGKTTLLNLLGLLVHRPLPTNNITPAALFRTTEKWSPTLLVDEADTFARDADELRGILNSGHNRAQAYVIRTVGQEHEPKRFTTWAPKAVALIGKLPDTLQDRAIEIRLERKKSSEQVCRLPAHGTGAFSDSRRKIARWADDLAEHFEVAEPEIPIGLHDRAADNWEPLLAIADLAGGEWPVEARKAALALTGQGRG